MHKVLDGGWFPLALGAGVFLVMTTWRRGREILFARLSAAAVPLRAFLDGLFASPPRRIPGTAVFLTALPDVTPNSMLHSLKHYKVLHERVVFLTVEFLEVPTVPHEERAVIERLGADCWRLYARFGFTDQPDAIEALQAARAKGLDLNLMETSFFLSRERIIPAAGAGGMALWRERLFAAMARNAGNIADYFNIPPNRVVELGTRVEF
jgi:KUP system potassium uptake protein